MDQDSVHMVAALKVPMLKPAFVSSNSTNSTNGAVNTAHAATSSSTQATTINSTTINNLCDAVICAFFASQPNSPQLDNEDLQQIHPDDLEEMDLRWQMAMLTMRARRFLKNTRRSLLLMVMRPLGLISQRNRENTRRVVPVETTTSNALVSCNGSGYDWSDQAEKGPTNFALMAYSFTRSNSEIVDKCKTGLGYNAVPPPYTGKFMPPKPDLSFSGLEELHVVPIGIKREFSVARTPQQNGVAERKNRTLIEAARTMLANSKLHTTIWAEAVNNCLLCANRLLQGNPSNRNTCTKACDDAGKARMETVPGKDDGSKPLIDDDKKVDEDPRKDSESIDQEKDDNVNSTNNVNAASTNEVNVVGGKISIELPDDLNMPTLEDIVYSDNDQDVGAEANMNNLDAFMPVSPIPTTRVHKDRLVEQIIGDLNLAPQTRRMTKNLEEHGLFSSVQQRTNHKDFQNCLFASFLSQVEPKKIIQALHNLQLLLKVNAARHNLLLLLKVNAARHNLLLLLKVNAARYNLLLLLKVNAARHKHTTAIES
ncbi:ribonuclease H-like domain-containing protein [Tanacetum coccineum]